jgi:hypothetical protein
LVFARACDIKPAISLALLDTRQRFGSGSQPAVYSCALEWSSPYKSATEKYSTQVVLNDEGELTNYVAGLPFPLLDPNDPQVAAKVMWNFSFRPQYTDDVDARNVEVVSSRPGSPAGARAECRSVGR